MRRNQLLWREGVDFVRVEREFKACESRMETGCLGGLPLNVRVMLSRQNWRRREPTWGVETVSATCAISMLKARMARYAAWEVGGMKARRV